MSFVIGCDSQQEATKTSALNYTLPTLQGGRLVFKSKEDFKTFGTLFHQNKLDLAKSLPSDYLSLKAAYKQEDVSEKTLELYAIPMGEFMRTFLNKDGEVQIDQSVFKVTPDKVYEVDLQRIAVLKNPDNEILSKRSAFLSVNKFYRVQGNVGECKRELLSSSPPKRTIGFGYSNWVGFYAEVGVSTEYQQKDRRYLFSTIWDEAPLPVSVNFSGTITHDHALYGYKAHPYAGYVNGVGHVNVNIYSDYLVTSPIPMNITALHIGGALSCTSTSDKGS